MKNDTNDPCWKSPGHEMRAWAEEWEEEIGNQGHGLGDLSQPCEPIIGEVCLACGKEWFTLH
jgi:hypothetical protein